MWTKHTPKNLEELRTLVSDLCEEAVSLGYKPDEVYLANCKFMLTSERLSDGSDVLNLEVAAVIPLSAA